MLCKELEGCSFSEWSAGWSEVFSNAAAFEYSDSYRYPLIHNSECNSSSQLTNMLQPAIQFPN